MDIDAGNQVAAARHSIAERWGGDAAVLAEGFVAVPRAFLRLAGTFRPSLSPAETLFVIQLMSWKWDDRAPFPGYSTVANRMGVSVPYARKIARSLERKKLLRRQVRRGQTNRFDLTPLFAKLIAQVNDDRPERKSTPQGRRGEPPARTRPAKPGVAPPVGPAPRPRATPPPHPSTVPKAPSASPKTQGTE